MGMKKSSIAKLMAVAILLCSLGMTACKSSVNMHRHNRSDCDCPTF